MPIEYIAALAIAFFSFFVLRGKSKSRRNKGSKPQAAKPRQFDYKYHHDGENPAIRPRSLADRLASQRAGSAAQSFTYVARKPLHAVEQDLYWKLRLSIPSYSVLPQVAMSQIVEPVPNIYEAWNPIARKVVDFLVLRRDFTPICVIEPDGRHHQEQVQKAKDEKRDAALNAAGIPVIRWTPREIPSEGEIAAIIKRLDLGYSAPS